MNEKSNAADVSPGQIDASCRVPLLALFGGAALWLVVGLVLALIASIKFHQPEFLVNCSLLTYGRVQAAANDLILYGFAIPAGLGVMLWIFARLSQAELILPLVPVVAANIWHAGVFIGLVAILIGETSGFAWLEFPRASFALMLAAFILIALSAAGTFGQRRERELYPSHWFLLAALLWFPWIYSTANIFLLIWPVRGVAQAVINWWYVNNLIFVWLTLVGLGVAFYFLPKLGGKPLHSRFYAQFAFWTLTLFGTFLGIPQGAPVPAWFPAASTLASVLLIIPLIAVAIIFVKTVCGAGANCKGGPFCQVKFGTVVFLLSGLMLIAISCPHFSQITRYTWFETAQTQLQIFGFFAIVILAGANEILPRIMASALPFPKFVRVQHWCFMLGTLLLVGSLAVSGIEQGLNNYSFATALPALRISTLGLFLLLIGSLLFAANVFVMTIKWKLGLAKVVFTTVTAPLKTAEVKS
ncbi:MAG TPA: cbb3-type cytochrome c oxidase subunit I [Verrucomicrobiae bacterium]